MIAINPTFGQLCRRLLTAFFRKYPNERIRMAANRALAMLVACRLRWSGKPGGWAGGLVYAISSIGVGVPGVLNRELEEVFGVSMSTIYKRAAKIRELLGPDLPIQLDH